MVTVLNNPSVPGTVERTIDRTDHSAGWAVAVIVLLAIVAIGGFLLLRDRIVPAAAPTSNGGDTVNVTLPSADTTGGGNVNDSAGVTPAPAQ